MEHRRKVAVWIVALLVGLLAFSPAQASHDDDPGAGGSIDNTLALQQAIQSGQRVKVIVQLVDPALAVYTGGIQNIGATKPEPGSKLDLTTDNAGAYLQYLTGKQNEFITALRTLAPSAVVLDTFQIVVNGLAIELNGGELPAVISASGVKAVTVTRTFTPMMNVSLPLIGAQALWTEVGGPGPAGANMFVGIIDTGIDIRNPFFHDQGYQMPFGFPKTDNQNNLQYVNKKVVVARAYPRFASQADDAKDQRGHGSHVSGTVAGNHNTSASVRGVAFKISGVAPRAYLGNYNVFPFPSGGTDDEPIIAAIEDAVADGMDAINMSLGGTVLSPADLDPLTTATNNAVDAGVIAAVAAGNSGPGAQTVTSPGNAAKAITAGASTNPHFVGQPVSVTGPGNVPANLQNFGAAAGDFKVYESQTAAQFAWWAGQADSPGTACSDRPAGNLTPPDPTPAVSVEGKIALIARGDCTFTSKIRNAEAAKAVGVIIYNNVAGDPVAMGHAGGPLPGIPAVMVSNANGVAMREWYQANNNATVRVDPEFAEFKTPNADIIAGFSSRGPTRFDFLLKPEVTAPGVNVLSAINTPTGFAFFQGTSMASPHVAGSATVLKQKFPKWAPVDVKSALVTTGKRPVTDHVTGQSATGVMTRGGGRINLSLAKDPRVTADSPTLGLGVVTAGTFTRDVVLTDTGKGSAWTVTASAPTRPDGTPASGVAVSISPTSVTLEAGKRTTIKVTFVVGATAVGQFEGDIILVGSLTLRIPYWLSVGPP